MSGAAVQFGSRALPLFGLFEPAANPRRRASVLICPPLGWEYLRAHRTLRLLATRLVDLGYDVLRFDYRGTGDSAGRLDDVEDAADFVADVSAALEELQSLSGNDRTILLGLREGASFAAAAGAAASGTRVSRLVLWDHPSWDEGRAAAASPESSDSPLLPLPPLRASLLALRSAPSPASDVPAVLVSSFSEESIPSPWRERAAAIAAGVGSPACWVEERDFGAGAVPVRLLERILDVGFPS
ncbi:MAG: alpha/beta hydrolase [Gemmatimonadaceae bacterium]|nr:alpha/beta hydrolase [Gemmatimonadaceae bacterium]